jgi:hypothetical protein
MSEIYNKYLELESKLIELQNNNPNDDADPLEEDIADELADMWYNLDESERKYLKEVHKHRILH